MQDQVITRIQQARIHVRRGNVDRGIALLEQARAMASGDPQGIPVILRELVEAHRLAGHSARAELLAEELAVLSPGSTTGKVELQAIEEQNPRHIVWMGGVLGSLLAVALGVIVWMWSGQHYSSTSNANSADGTLASPGIATPAGPANAIVPPPSGGPGPAKTPSLPKKRLPAVNSNSAQLSRDRLIHSNVAFLLHVAKYQGNLNGAQCQLELPVGSGSCFAVGRNGIMLTNKHVTAIDQNAVPGDCSILGLPSMVRRSMRMVVCLGPKPSEQFEAQVVHESTRYDLAIIRIHKTFDSPVALAGVRPGLGQPVYAVGFPGVVANVLRESNAEQVRQQLGRAAASGFISFTNWFSQDAFEPTLTRGIVSTTERQIENASYIQVDAAVSEGNSGGPLLAENNEVVGICSSKVAGMDSYNFVLSIPQIRGEIDKALRQP